MYETQKLKTYDLEERTAKFARNVIGFVNLCPKTTANFEINKQLIRAAGSVGANYIEANEALSKKDFAMRVKICRKEAKESRYWLTLIEITGEAMENKRQTIVNESTELLKIFSSIVEKSTK
jgi:four helix bundle protein